MKLNKVQDKNSVFLMLLVLERSSKLGRGGLGATLALHHGAELHSQTHVALDLQLALHERLLAVELAARQGHEVAVLHADSAVGLALFAFVHTRVGLEVDGPFLVAAIISGEVKKVDTVDLLGDRLVGIDA